MAAQVLSGSQNASYTNNTGQNVRLIINFMASCTSMTWAGVTIDADGDTVGKAYEEYDVLGQFMGADIQTTAVTTWNNRRGRRRIATTVRNVVGLIEAPITITTTTDNRRGAFRNVNTVLSTGVITTGQIRGKLNQLSEIPIGMPNIFYVPTKIVKTSGSNAPEEVMLAPNQSFSAVCGAYNIVVIREDGQ